MKQLLLILFLAVAGISFGQGKPAVKLSFPDSVRIVLENTKNVDATTVGAAFAGVWANIGYDLQSIIKEQSAKIKKKGYRLRPEITNYFGAIADAINLESAEPEKLKSFLMVTDKVINLDSRDKANGFFTAARDFFEHGALYFDKSTQLYARDDDFSFEYITDVVYDPMATLPPDTLSAWQPSPDPPIDTGVTSIMSPVFTPSVTPPPSLSGPIIRFKRLSLVVITKHDSVTLSQTKGEFSMRTRMFVGDGGRIDWTNAGLSTDTVQASIQSTYFFKTSKPEFKIEWAKINYTGRTPGMVEGTIEFKSTAHKTKLSAAWPKFTSFESNIRSTGLPNEKLSFMGGFSLTGSRVGSQSLNGGLSTLTLRSDSTNSERFVIQARNFDFSDSTIIARDARAVIYHGGDSITHQSVDFRYNVAKEVVGLTKSKGRLMDSPYASSFFGMDFTSDDVRWDLKTDKLDLYTSGSVSQTPMVIESIDRYNSDDFELMKGVGFSFHPLMLVNSFCRDNRTDMFYVDDMANKRKKDVSEIRRAMDFLSRKGYVFYNPTNGQVTVRPKLYVMAKAYKDEADYDNLLINSVIEKVPNSTVDLRTGEMTVRGVEELTVSDSLNFSVFPDSAIITLGRNRGIKFNGKITAGNFEIRGKEFQFSYDSFLIQLNRIDSIRFFVLEKNAKGQMVRKPVNNALVGADSTAAAVGGLDVNQVIQKKSGTLYLNVPDNKSGRMPIPNFPNLDASGGGVTYFDKKEVLNGIYKRKIFFVVPPFKLDSLSDADPASINFDGTFGSNGIFPSFKEKLHTMPDNSLGFTHETEKAGYLLYKKPEAKFTGSINLDNKGLRGNGQLDFFSTSLKSNDFIFYPDSVSTIGTVGEIKEQQVGAVWFPQMTLPQYRLTWEPKADQFDLKNIKDPFQFYKNTTQLYGRLSIGQEGVSGGGRISTRGSDILSNDLKFEAKSFSANHARFQVKTGNAVKPALAGRDVRVKFFLDQNMAEINPEVEGTAALTFPYAQFKTSIPTARWDLNTQKIIMTKGDDVPLENSYFYTTRKDLDSLVFNATQAEYDINTQQLKVSGIPYIVVADAKITPQGSEILILENSKIGRLTNTTIVLDTLNSYHRLTEGVVDIISRKKFEGYATYQYVNAINDTFAIKMTDFHLEDIVVDVTKKRKTNVVATQQTVAKGAVTPEEKMQLAPRIFYKGDMVMYATKPALQLKGFIKLDFKRIPNYNTWLVADRSGEEKDFFLDFDKLITEEGKKADAGLHYTQDNKLYINFITAKRNEDDEDFFVPGGSLFYDTAGNEFKIEDRAKAAGEKLSGKVLAYNEEKQEVRFEGPISFFKALPGFDIGVSVIGSGNIETSEIKMNALVMADMKAPDQVYQLIGQDLANIIANETVEEGQGDHTELLYKVANVVGEKVAKEYESRSLQNYFPLAQVPGMVKPMVFSNVDLKFSQKHSAFYSTGNLGLSNLGRIDINAAFEGFMEARRAEDGSPIFHIFMKASPEAWYYFGYDDHRLMIHSSNQAINDVMSKKTNAAKAKVGELVYIPGSNDEALAFINRFRKDYLEIETPYDLMGESSKKEKKEKEKKEDDGF